MPAFKYKWSQPRRATQGFTLMELIGVMAIMAILAGALAPQVFRLLDEGFQSAEEKSLATIGQSLERSIRSTHQIPAPAVASWTAAVASYASLPQESVRLNAKNFERRLYVDPNFYSTANATFPGYQQTVGLASQPFSPRVMVISNLDGNVNTNLNTGAAFEAVWSQTGTPPIVESASLLIERLHLAPLFHRVLLQNAAAQQAGYRLEGGTEGAIAAAASGIDGSRTLWVLSGSQMALTAAPFPGGATLRQLIVDRQLSLRYEDSSGTFRWSD